MSAELVRFTARTLFLTETKERLINESNYVHSLNIATLWSISRCRLNSVALVTGRARTLKVWEGRFLKLLICGSCVSLSVRLSVCPSVCLYAKNAFFTAKETLHTYKRITWVKNNAISHHCSCERGLNLGYKCTYYILFTLHVGDVASARAPSLYVLLPGHYFSHKDKNGLFNESNYVHSLNIATLWSISRCRLNSVAQVIYNNMLRGRNHY